MFMHRMFVYSVRFTLNDSSFAKAAEWSEGESNGVEMDAIQTWCEYLCGADKTAESRGAAWCKPLGEVLECNGVRTKRPRGAQRERTEPDTHLEYFFDSSIRHNFGISTDMSSPLVLLVDKRYKRWELHPSSQMLSPRGCSTSTKIPKQANW